MTRQVCKAGHEAGDIAGIGFVESKSPWWIKAENNEI